MGKGGFLIEKRRFLRKKGRGSKKIRGLRPRQPQSPPHFGGWRRHCNEAVIFRLTLDTVPINDATADDMFIFMPRSYARRLLQTFKVDFNSKK